MTLVSNSKGNRLECTEDEPCGECSVCLVREIREDRIDKLCEADYDE